MKNIPEIFFFDMDGTLIDSEKSFMNRWNEGLKIMGLDPNKSDYTNLIGHGNDFVSEYTKNIYGDDFELNQLFHAMTKIKEEPEKLRDGVEDLLHFLEKRNIRKAVVTSNTKQAALNMLSETKIIGHFEFILTKDDANELKPDPELYLLAIKISGLNPEQCLVIEDSYPGAVSAQRANLKYISVPSIPGQILNNEVTSNALEVFTSMKDLYKWTKKLFENH